MAAANELPDYRLFLDESVKHNQVIFLNRTTKIVMEQATKARRVDWVAQLLQKPLH